MENEKRLISSKILFEAVLQELDSYHLARFTVTGMSMWPLICHGRDDVIIEKVDTNTIKKGDIVLLKINDKYVLHRITKVRNNYIETTGDSNFYHDGLFKRDCILAKVIIIVRNGKNIYCDSFIWRLYAFVWMKLFRFRRIIFDVWFKVRKYIRK